MTLKDNEKQEFDNIASGLLDNEHVKSMGGFVQHGSVSTLEHCISVAETCFAINRRLPICFNEKSLVKAALLHDFYLYDWHIKSELNRLHGFHHPSIAAENARKLIGVTDKEADAIKTHMWPLTITKLPKNREAWLLCFADKYCAMKETVKR